MKKYSQKELIKNLNLIMVDPDFRQTIREKESSGSLTNKNIKDFLNFNYEKIYKAFEIEEITSFLLEFLGLK